MVVVGVGGHVGWHGWVGRPGVDPYRQININHTEININTRNIYKDRADVDPRLPDRGQLRERPVTRDIKGPSSSGPNNLVADRDGNVYRKDDTSWKQYDGKSFDSVDRRPDADRSSFESQRASLDRELKARDRGTQLQNQSRNIPSSGGARRGGRGGTRR